MEKIEFFEEEVRVAFLKRRLTRKCLEKVVSFLKKKSGEINYIFCTDEYLYKMNEAYLKHDTYTDIITFDYTEKNILSGDIFISIERIKENAKMFHVKQNDELNRVMVHGVLHLAGYKDKTPEEAKKMREMENKCMEKCFVEE
ncbi:MAG: rRNA maturation RNase YbeY [Bacteroidales bacterium]